MTGTKAALLIGTRSKDGHSNLALFSSVFHLGADPALIGLVQRPLTDQSHTYKNMVETGFFTVNQIDVRFAVATHHTSAKFERDVSEFDACGFQEEEWTGYTAPFVKESIARMGVRYLREIPIEENGTRIILGQVEEIQVNEGLLRDDGNIDPDVLQPLAVFGLEAYLQTSVLARYAYAKPGVSPTKT
ncbi:MAG: flavin reductase family protein [Bacteroidota bacterium]